MATLPALSVAVQVTLLRPALVVSTLSQRCEATPEVASVALGVAVTSSPIAMSLSLLSDAASSGGV